MKTGLTSYFIFVSLQPEEVMNKRNNALSIQLLWQSGAPANYIYAAMHSLLGTVAKLGLEERITIEPVGSLPTLNVDVLLNEARKEGSRIHLMPGQADIRTVGRSLESYVMAKGKRAPRLFLIAADDYSIQEPEEEYVFGYTTYPESCTVSTYRHATDQRITDRLGLFSLMVIHEFGHLINAADAERGEALKNWLGMHCTNACVMRQRDDLPDFERDVLPHMNAGHLFCDLCTRDIRRFMDTRHPLASP